MQLVSAAGQHGGQQVVQMAGGQPMMVMQSQGQVTSASSAPVTSDAALAQLAAEAGLLEAGEAGEGDLAGGQLDGGYVTPQDGVSEVGDPIDIQQYLDLFQTQVDGDPGDIESESGEVTDQNNSESTTAENTEETTEQNTDTEKSSPEDTEQMDTSNVQETTPSESEPVTESDKTEDAVAPEKSIDLSGEPEAPSASTVVLHSTLGGGDSTETEKVEEKEVSSHTEEVAASEPEPEPEKPSSAVLEESVATTATDTITSVTEPVESVLTEIATTMAGEVTTAPTETLTSSIDTVTTEEAQTPEVAPEEPVLKMEEEKPAVLASDQADFDGASALAALASVATSSPVTSLSTSSMVKKEESAVVSQAISLPVPSVQQKQETKDLKSELDEVKWILKAFHILRCKKLTNDHLCCS